MTLQQQLNSERDEEDDTDERRYQIRKDIAAFERTKQMLVNEKAQMRIHNEANDRVNQLMEEQQKLNAQLADIEQQQDIAELYQQNADTMLENAINALFQHVTFRLFRTQVNGERLPFCECMMDGVPYQDLNTASRINAGIDIINTLSKQLNVYAPVVIDNAEAVNNLLPTTSQNILLYVNTSPQLVIQ